MPQAQTTVWLSVVFTAMSASWLGFTFVDTWEVIGFPTTLQSGMR